MDSPRQIIRYGIPGSLGIIWAIGSFVVIKLFAGDSITDALSPVTANGSVVAAALSSIPLGWTVYQLYYHSYGPTFFRFVRGDRGLYVLSHLTASQRERIGLMFPGQGLGLPMAKPETKQWLGLPFVYRLRPNANREDYRKHWKLRWHVVCALLDLVAAGKGSELKQEYTSLSDVYHGIGAARTAIRLGAAVGILAAIGQALLRDAWESTMWWGIAAVVVVTLFWVSYILRKVRTLTWESSGTRLGHGLRLYFANDPDILTRRAVNVATESVWPEARPDPRGDLA